ncbi:choice-of-anchor X domain-containing protein [Marinicella rhabdoformis]|uniref:choice-of-anchor X domain-containing protein n=1 Tax=Marinicella rhabdoformis TaxID=2580566 RepID=UPI0012AEB857|nr:choice-of-anchor X domain-containing protein [Marinicella rhabdoformis]
MKLQNTLLSISGSVLLFATTTASAAPQVKHLAGPAEEIQLMQKAAPEAAAIVSKSALVPVNLSDSSTWNKQLLIDGDNPKVLLFSPNADQWEVKIKANNHNKSLNLKELNYTVSETLFGMAEEKFPAVQYDLQNMTSGRYQFNIKNLNKSKGQGEGYLLLSGDSPYQLSSFTGKHGYLVGEEVTLFANALTSDNSFTMVKNDLQLIQSANIRITAPDGNTSSRTMFDDGFSIDKAAFDGQFTTSFVAQEPGLYRIQVEAHGLTPKGKPFFRTIEHVVPVIDDRLKLTSKAATGEYVADHKINLTFSTQQMNKAMSNSRYRVIAEVWGQGLKGEEKAITWLSSIVDTKGGEINLQLDDRWLLSAGQSQNYSLKNIRIEDINHYISVLEIDQLNMRLPVVSEKSARLFDGQITQSMLFGNKPKSVAKNKAAGGKLMLVHGYCSSDVWGSQQGQFSNSVKFSDFNQNRSHDAFAQRIDTFGDNYPSFGIVAHSQGGAAALHLYSYYWSGLDDAGSGRLIQSVGTPYQGTPLAGNLASVGNVFGVGCGYNSNLTTSGASSWLAGIPTWARNAVNYYTTSPTTKWWRPDWCQIVTDPFLRDPDDGTTEKHRGQLSGGVNRGHKTGQCHTDGMRDMAQTKDSGRNSTMSSNASR